MNSLQIEKLLARQRRCAPFFVGCLPADRLPAHVAHYPWCAVVNTDRAHESGSHWVALYVPSASSAEYFDSFGAPPNQPIGAYLRAHFKSVRHNAHPFQSVLSKACGKYAIYFLMRRCAGDSLDAIVQRLLNAQTNADRLVCAYVARLFNNNVP